MTLYGSIEHRYVSRNIFNESFVSLHNFLSSTCAPLGVTRIACSTGSSGIGMSYHDTNEYAGNNAWAVFKFGNALSPFYTLIQYTTAPNLGTLPGSPAIGDGNASTNYCVAISVAFNEDGTSPWNGTTNNDGTDTKGSTVWVSGSSRAHIFPRSNNLTGSHNTSTNNMHTFFKSAGYSKVDLFNLTEGGTGAVQHFYADEDNFLILSDPGAMGNFSAVYYGRYTPRTDISASHPYMMAGWYTTNTDQNPFKLATVYGNTAGTTGSTIFQGGIVHPNSTYGVRAYSQVLHELFHQSRFHPNRSVVTASNRYDEHKPMLVMNEEPNHFGFVGTTSDFFKIAWGIPTGAVSSSGDWAAFNLSFAFGLNRPWNTYAKIVVPWTGSVSPYSLTSRLGTQFTR